jgi:hypothetical protein
MSAPETKDIGSGDESSVERGVALDTPEQLRDFVEILRSKLDVRDRTYHMRTYKSVFVGSDCVSWLVEHGE